MRQSNDWPVMGRERGLQAGDDAHVFFEDVVATKSSEAGDPWVEVACSSNEACDLARTWPGANAPHDPRGGVRRQAPPHPALRRDATWTGPAAAGDGAPVHSLSVTGLHVVLGDCFRISSPRSRTGLSGIPKEEQSDVSSAMGEACPRFQRRQVEALFVIAPPIWAYLRAGDQPR